jgi:hypothetical protein
MPTGFPAYGAAGLGSFAIFMTCYRLAGSLDMIWGRSDRFRSRGDGYRVENQTAKE